MAEIIEISRLALHDQVAARLRTWLVEGRIPPGAKLNERALCDQLRVSRTPVREAIKTLAQEGLLRSLPNRSPVVQSASTTGDAIALIWLGVASVVRSMSSPGSTSDWSTNRFRTTPPTR